MWSELPLENAGISLSEQVVGWEFLGLTRLGQWISYMCEVHPRAHMTHGAGTVIRIDQ